MFSLRFNVVANLVTPRSHAQIMREINRGILQRWRARFLPLHFQGGASSRYGYRPRTAKYVARKRKKFGHNIPLVYTGGTRDAVIASAAKDSAITATQHRARLRARGRPFGDGLGGLTAEMRGEIERIPRTERDELVRWATNEYLRLAKKPEYKRQRRRRGS